MAKKQVNIELALMSDREFCLYMVNQVADALKGREYLSLVKAGLEKEGYQVSDNIIYLVKGGKVYNRRVAYQVYLVGQRIREEVAA